MVHDEAYQQAERRIETALQMGSKALSLGWLGLDELPGSIDQFSHLQVLDLSGNQLTPLPEWLGQLTELRELYIPFNQLTETWS